MPVSRRAALGIWLLAIAACAGVIARTAFRTDMAAFLPRTASPGERVLTEQVRGEGASRVILLGVQGASPSVLARLSESLANDLRHNHAFLTINNGDRASLAAIREYFWRHRYLLSSDVTPAQFTVQGLHASLENDLALLGSDLGSAFQNMITSDPTGTGLSILSRDTKVAAPPVRDGVWMSQRPNRALLLAHTRASGFDVDAQQHAIAAIEAAFRRSRKATPNAARAHLLESGPGVFAVLTRATIEHDVTWLSLLATMLVASLLLFAYRSPRVLLLGMLPVVSGALAGITAVSLGFGYVHGITLGFGISLIGESIDYAIYTLTQTSRGRPVTDTLRQIWPTLLLGALTSVAGFSVMLFSDVAGFAQLGLFSIAGLVIALGTTRLVLPYLTPRHFFAPGGTLLARPLMAAIRHRQTLRPAIGILAGVGILALFVHRGVFWNDELATLSPIPPAAQRVNQTLRQDMNVPDLRYFVVLGRPLMQQALEASEHVARILRELAAQHVLKNFSAPSDILPSDRTQQQRQAALPKGEQLHARFAQAMAALPFRVHAFSPFFRAVAAARVSPLLTPASLPPVLQMQLGSMLFRNHGRWNVLIPLREVSDPERIAQRLGASQVGGVHLVDLAEASRQLLLSYQRDARHLAIAGSLAIIALLIVALRSPRRVFAVVAPLAAAEIVTAAFLTAGGHALSIFTVVGFLLIMAVGSNYCLFFERGHRESEDQRQLIGSIVLANLCTVSVYGLMAVSHIPVLHDIGITVATGAFLSLLFASVLSTGRSPAPHLLQHDEPFNGPSS